MVYAPKLLLMNDLDLARNFCNKHEPMAPERIHQLLNDVVAYCAENGISQAEFARRLGIQRSQLHDWIKGRREPTGERVLAIIEELRKKPRKKKS